MIRSRPGLRSCLALLLAPALLAQAPGLADFRARLGTMDLIVERFYRGETLEAGHERVNALVEAFNAQLKERNAALEAARAQAEREVAPSRELSAALAEQDKALGEAPDPSDQPAVKRYNARVEARNALADRCNALLEKAQQAAEGFNALMKRLNDETDQARARLGAEQQAQKARADAYEAFRANERDMAFYAALNRLLAEVRGALRAHPDPGLQEVLDKVRGLRRDLAAWAAAHEAAQENGLVLVEALVADEPCCFIVDTGAQRVCLPTELVEAMGLSGSLGEEATLTLAGGQKIRGRSITFPVLSVAGMTGTAVAGSAVPASEVGIDGLLGQSFLKRFVYTIDEGRPGRLILVRR